VKSCARVTSKPAPFAEPRTAESTAPRELESWFERILAARGRSPRIVYTTLKIVQVVIKRIPYAVAPFVVNTAT